MRLPPLNANLLAALRAAGPKINVGLHAYLVDARANILDVLAQSTDYGAISRLQGYAAALDELVKILPQVDKGPKT